MNKIKSVFALIICLVMMFTIAPLSGIVPLVSAETYSGTCGENLKWSLEQSSGLLEITGTGDMTDWEDYVYVPWRLYVSNITSVKISGNVTSIGEFAFYNCNQLKNVTIGEKVTSIGYSAFCNCDSLTSVTIPNSVRDIGPCAFKSCKGLTSVTIGKSVKSIGLEAFSACKKLGKITIPDSVTSIDTSVFSGCDNLRSVKIGSSVNRIPAYAFYECVNLSIIDIPDSVTSIGTYAFYSCNSLEKLIIPDSVTSISYNAFVSCNSLTNITVDSENKNYSSDSYGVLFNKNKTELIKYPNANKRKFYTIPNSVTGICSYAFSSCDSLTSITITDSVTKIDFSAFDSCTGLTNITIPNSITCISSGTFSGCSNLKSVTIPESVTSIDAFAFENCGEITDVYFGGSKYEWSKIEIDEENEDLTNAVIHYAKISDTNTLSSVTTKLTSLVNTVNGPKLTWEATGGAKGYYVYRKTSGTSWKRLASTTSTNYTDKTVKSGENYIYTAKAYNGTSTSKFQSGLTLKCLTSPTVSSVSNTTAGASIKWGKITGATRYYIYRKTLDGTYKNIGNTTSLSFVDKTGASGTKYYYIVRAGYGKTLSSYRAGTGLIYLTAPTVSSVSNTTAGVKVAWGKVTGASGYYVYRKTANSSYARIGTTNATSFTDKTAKKGTTYYYTVRGYSGKTLSSYKAGAKHTRR